MAIMTTVTIEDVRRAADRIKGLAHRTPVVTSRSIDEMAGCRVYFKCENLQRAGAFKFRGAANAVFSLRDEEARRGVATHSSGNHAAAIALAARCRGIPAYVVLPTNAPETKRLAAIRYGAKVIPCGPTLADREGTIQGVLAETGANFIHPYDDDRVIAGQGTATLELLGEVPGLTALLAPVSGGGLMAGTAITGEALRPGIALYGAEPANADDARRSVETGVLQTNASTNTIADGLRAQLSWRTLSALRPRLREVITVTEEQIVSATRVIWERLKLVTETSSAVPLAAILARREAFRGGEVGVILSGGNLDLDKLPWQG
jgi:threonine dehydratase/serine racemase